jgi:hypothetical protein
LDKKHKVLEQSFEKHLATQEVLIETREKIKEAHFTLFGQKESIEIANTGNTCDIIDDIPCVPIIFAPTNLSRVL